MSKPQNNFLLFGWECGDGNFPKYPRLNNFFRKISGKKIYHAVPAEHEDSFSGGHVVLPSAANIRRSEYGDSGEGVQSLGCTTTPSVTFSHVLDEDFHLFCMSLSENIGKIRREFDKAIRPRVLYEVDICRFISFLKANYETPGFFGFESGIKTASGSAGISVNSAWGQCVSYSGDPKYAPFMDALREEIPPPSQKDVKFQAEREIRLAFKFRWREETEHCLSMEKIQTTSEFTVSFDIPLQEQKMIFNKIM